MEQHGERGRTSHTGERLLAKFNRLARDTRADAGELGEISGFTGNTILVRTADGSERACEVRSALTKMISGVRNPLCVGDRVRWEKTSGESGIIVSLEPRRNQLARADSHNKALLHVLAANIDRLVVVSAIAQPDLKTGFIDRYLLIAHLNGIEPIVVLNKADLGTPSEIEVYRKLGFACFLTTTLKKDPEVERLRDSLRGLTTLIAGQSGVGKSSLINVLYPAVAARTGKISTDTGKGRHTTTSSRSYPTPDGGSLIDTPGLKECGITGLTAIDVALLYPDIAPWHPKCKFNDCTHRHEPDCAVIAAVERGDIAVFRYLSYCSIIDEDLDQ